MCFAISEAVVAAAGHIHFRQQVPLKGRVVRPTPRSQSQSVQTRHSEVLVVLYLKCVVAGLVTLTLVFGVIFVASLVLAVAMIGFSGFGFEKPLS
jgi:hypothetical protein